MIGARVVTVKASEKSVLLNSFFLLVEIDKDKAIGGGYSKIGGFC